MRYLCLPSQWRELGACNMEHRGWCTDNASIPSHVPYTFVEAEPAIGDLVAVWSRLGIIDGTLGALCRLSRGGGHDSWVG